MFQLKRFIKIFNKIITLFLFVIYVWMLFFAKNAIVWARLVRFGPSLNSDLKFWLVRAHKIKRSKTPVTHRRTDGVWTHIKVPQEHVFSTFHEVLNHFRQFWKFHFLEAKPLFYLHTRVFGKVLKFFNEIATRYFPPDPVNKFIWKSLYPIEILS